MVNFSYNVHGLVGVRSNTPILEPLLGYFRSAVELPRPLMVVEVKSRLTRGPNEVRHFEGFQYRGSAKEIYFEQLRPVPVKLLVKNIEQDPTIEVTPSFCRVPTIFRGGIDLEHLLKEILILKLIEKDHLFLHSACVELNGRGTLLTAFPGTGKTATSLGLVRECAAGFLSDEYTICNANGELLAFPSLSAIHPPLIESLDISLRLRDYVGFAYNTFMAIFFPTRFHSAIWTPAYMLIKPDAIRSRTRLEVLVFLEKGPRGIIQVSKEEAIRKVTRITRYEFPFASNPVLLAYSYGNAALDLEKYEKDEAELIRRTVHCSEKCFVVSSTHGHLDLLKDLIGEGF